MVLSFAGEFRPAMCRGCLLFQPHRSPLDFIIASSRGDV